MPVVSPSRAIAVAMPGSRRATTASRAVACALASAVWLRSRAASARLRSRTAAAQPGSRFASARLRSRTAAARPGSRFASARLRSRTAAARPRSIEVTVAFSLESIVDLLASIQLLEVKTAQPRRT
jgi:hypothetical protein